MSITHDGRQPPQFSTLPTIDGFDVIDDRGRPIDRRETLASANGVAFLLNGAARQGAKALIRALNHGGRIQK